MKETAVKSKIKNIIHVLNPRAGKGRVSKIKEQIDKSDITYMSNCAEDAMNFIEDNCRKNPDCCFTVYGGDGTVYKAVNAIMRSGLSDTVSLKIVPCGSGNDFVHTLDDIENGINKIDVMKVNDSYAVNVVNAGFDCNVVRRAERIRKNPFIGGKFAYILGVVEELVGKKSFEATVTLKYSDGSEETISEKILLVAVGNARYYGGGFKVTPTAQLDDGILDVMIVRDVTRKTFVSLVSDYKNGTFIDENGELDKRFEKIIYYKRCVGIKVDGCESFCADGEIINETSFEVNVVPKAINLIIKKEAN